MKDREATIGNLDRRLIVSFRGGENIHHHGTVTLDMYEIVGSKMSYSSLSCNAINAVSKIHAGFKESYEQHYVKKINMFTHPSFDNKPLWSMCATLTMQQWH